MTASHLPTVGFIDQEMCVIRALRPARARPKPAQAEEVLYSTIHNR